MANRIIESIKKIPGIVGYALFKSDGTILENSIKIDDKSINLIINTLIRADTILQELGATQSKLLSTRIRTKNFYFYIFRSEEDILIVLQEAPVEEIEEKIQNTAKNIQEILDLED